MYFRGIFQNFWLAEIKNTLYLSCMTAIPSASPLYAVKYKVEVEQKALKKLSSGKFHTHLSIHMERLHAISEAIFLPARWSGQLFGRIIEPLPGAGKEFPLWGIAIRIASLVLWIITLPVAAISALLAFPLRCIDHPYRPILSHIDNSAAIGAKAKIPEELQLTKEQPLHVRTHNLGFVPSSMSITGDLRPPIERAKELVTSICGDSIKPDIIFFQETFNEDATRVLCEGIKQEYPYIIHSVAPQISGFSSGALIASKYPIKEMKFQRFDHIAPPESMAPRGIIRVRLESRQGPLLLYGVHMEALIGEKRAKARFHQLEEIKQFMQVDAEQNPEARQILMGDFNTSRITAWGEDNLNPKGQAEEKVLERLNHYFDDLYLRDHDPFTGVRTSGKPRYLDVDNRWFNENLPEPSGSWYHGPFADPGFSLSGKMRYDRWKYNRPVAERVSKIAVGPSTWGTRAWHLQQVANTARFDYILTPRQRAAADKRLEGRVEIRRTTVPPQAQSASSDHLPVDGMIWVE